MNFILGIVIALAAFVAALTILWLVLKVGPYVDRLLCNALYGADEDEHASEWERR